MKIGMIDTDKTLFHLGWISGLNFPPLTVLLGRTTMLGIHNTADLFLAEHLCSRLEKPKPALIKSDWFHSSRYPVLVGIGFCSNRRSTEPMKA